MWTDKERKLHAQTLDAIRKSCHRHDAEGNAKSDAKEVFGRPAFSKGNIKLKKKDK